MIKIVCIILTMNLVVFFNWAYSQSMSETKDINGADIIVFITDNKMETDLIYAITSYSDYKDTYQILCGPNSGFWFFDAPPSSKLPLNVIYVTKNSKEADLIIYPQKTVNDDIGWQNFDKYDLLSYKTSSFE